MGAAILGSRDYLPGRFRHETLTLNPALAQPLKPRMQRNPSAKPGSSNPRHRRRSPTGYQSNSENLNRRNGSRSQAMVAKIPAENLVMGKVRILKRGESLESQLKINNRVVLAENRMPPRANKSEEGVDLGLGSTDRLGPDPVTVQKQIGKFVDGMYAGSAFLASPPPSSLPVPGFLGKGSNGAATSDLRRLLNLD